jgi:acyl-CoA synthetase (AMP-forming)/AMP-acid ligase II
MNTGLFVPKSADRNPAAIAAWDVRRELNYGDLDQRSSRIANALAGRFGLKRGDRVAVLMPNRVEVVEMLAACAKAGFVYVGLNFRLGEAEYEWIFDNAEPRVLITVPEFAELAEKLSARGDMPVVDVESEDFEALVAAGSATQPEALHQIRPEDDFCIVYTSGTTGRPKGILFDHAAALNHAPMAVLEYELGADSRWLMALPHNSSMHITLLPLLMMGGAIGFGDSRGFDPERFGAEVERLAATHTYLVPTMIFRLLEAGIDPARLESLQTIGYGAAPISPERVAEMVERYGPRFTQLYGMAEIASIGTMLRKDDHRRGLEGRTELFASCGRPSYEVDVRVVDQDGRDAATGERGEVIFGSPYTMKGYYRDDERTAESLIDGWMHSGDVGERDEEGYIFIVDRIKDLIIRGGFNIAPSEIENALYGHPAVLEAAVFGTPDAEWGEAVTAVVALKQGQVADAETLATWCREAGLPSVKVPERIEFLDSLPKNAVGKIAKRELRDREWSDGRSV